ncbi:MAG TPA: asparagine synthase (glutamine-hydrolyzing) [Candidatus Polarisedimenticolia bacterium]|jgi:asparagine synthase (glutamine-hydrolysing)|nr:asparagine synthase (glutamine-hydrolyzing) [Candidatus Polarisedimenticolia bacterium]
MCGIAGIVSLDGRPVDPREVRAMCRVMAHRGPDDEGLYAGRGAVLGMRRLSIIDLEAGHQPLGSEDESVWGVCNGEIYNFRELRADLLRRGHTFLTGSDSEVIVHLFEEHGKGCVEKLRGMFALAVWDERRAELLLARDRLGIKPLYYSVSGGRLAFASELKAILQLERIERRLSWGAVNHLFTSLCTPAAQSIVEGVRKLEPGHLLLASAERGIRIERYWDVSFGADAGRDETGLVERLRGLLDESVRLHMVSDVPVGAFLSGGIDSSSVVAIMAGQASGPVKTFSIGFDEQDYDELRYARQVAERYDTEHYELVVTPDAVDLVDDLAWFLDEPFGDSSALPTFMVSRLASQFVKVVLSGDGGDELFAGYDRYRVEGRERRYEMIPRPLRGALGALAGWMPETMRGRNLLRHLSLHGPERYLDAVTLFRAEEKRRLFRPAAFEMLSLEDPWQAEAEWLQRSSGDWLSALQYLDIKSYLPLDILTKVDRMSMAHGLETRVPLLDHRLVEFAATIPADLRLRDGVTKHILKRAMRGLLPDSIIDRPKQGFAVPLGRWFRGRLDGFVRDLLLSTRSRSRGILSETYVERLIERHGAGRPLDLQLWTLISFELWCRTFLDSRTPRFEATSAAPRVAAAPHSGTGVPA